MIPIASLIPDAVAAMLRRAPLTPEKVAFAWRMAVGPAVDRVTSVELVDKVLRVRTRDPAWRQEIERSEHLIRARLHTLLGRETVRAIRISA
jgi:hypothetical protein